MHTAYNHTDEPSGALKERIAASDPLAFRQLFEMYMDKLSSFATSIIKSPESAAEIVDEVFLKVWNNRSSITSINNLRVYLYSAVKNESLNHLSQKARRLVTEPFDEIDIQIGNHPDPEQLLITRELYQKIRAAVETLPPRCKMIFKLVREDGLQYKEVAEILNLSVKTIDAQMVIAVTRLREAVRQDFNLPVQKKSKKNQD